MPELVKSPTDTDILTISGIIGALKFESETPDPDSYLNGFIEKPWGHEYRIYCDFLFDVWKLQLMSGERTSMHCHARKDTVLLCLAGRGATSFLDGEDVPLSSGMFIYIERGVFHRTQAASDSYLELIEVENPRNKFDLLRIGDEYGRAAKGYETNSTVHEALAPMRAVGRTILFRNTDLSGRYEFSVGRLDPDLHKDTSLRAGVMMDIHHHLAGRISLLLPARHDFAEHAGSLALLIRENASANGDA